MSNFFEKLKKGMEIKELPEKEKKGEILNNFPLKEAVNESEQKKKTNDGTEVVLASTGAVETKEKKKKTGKIKKEKPVKKPSAAETLEKKESEKKMEKDSGKQKITIIQAPDNDKNALAEEKKAERKWFEPEGQLTVDVYQTEKELIIQSAIAGIQPEDLDISVENDVITIKGKRENFLEKETKNYFYQECYWGKFSREIVSPVEIDGSRAKASMKQGVLTIKIPKIEREKKRKIYIGV